MVGRILYGIGEKRCTTQVVVRTIGSLGYRDG